MGNEDLEDIIKELRKHISFLELGSSWGHIEMIIDKALKDTTKSTVESLELEEKTLKADDIMKTKLKGMSYEEAFGRHMENFKIIQEVNKWKAKQLKGL